MMTDKRRGSEGLRRFLTFVMFIITICSSGEAMSLKPPKNDFYKAGESVNIAVCGGEVCRIRNTGTVLDGIDIFPPRGLTLTITLNKGVLTLPDGKISANPVIGIDFKGSTEEPVRVSVPMKSGNEPPFCYAIDEKGSLSSVVSKPEEGGRFSFYTFRQGLFTWVE